jgi:hypothetical protein
MAAIAAIPGVLASMSGTTAAVAAAATTVVAANAGKVANAVANAANSVAKPSFLDNLKTVGMWTAIIVVVGAVLFGLYELFLYTKSQWDSMPTCTNINNTAAKQEAKVSKAATEIHASRSTLGTPDNLSIEPANTTPSPLAENEDVLANFAVLGIRSTGYLGPKDAGVFRAAAATNYAFLCGVRVFVLDIDYVATDPKTPLLVYRDTAGNLRSNNVGSIKEVADTMATFNTTDPIIVILNIIRVPGPPNNPASTEALKFMMKIAKALKAIQPRILDNINGNNAKKQGLGTSLFLYPVSGYSGKIVLLTNQDTTGFEKPPSTMPQILPDENLNLIVNGRLWPSVSSGAATNSADTTPPARYNSVSYYTSIPTDRQAAAIEETKHQWSIAMNLNPMDPEPSRADIDLLHKKLGVQCIATNLFNLDNIVGSQFLTADYFKKFSYRPKPKATRYVSTAPIVSAPPAAATNTGGGFIN